MNFKEGYVYHINDSYFTKVNDDKLMKNKENGTYRPTFFCMRDSKHDGLLWVVPMSTQVAKFQAIHDKKQAKYGNCLSIVIGEFDNKPAAFLLQNMFPITEKYLDHIHTRNGQPVPVKHSIIQEVHSNMQKLRQFIYSGRNNVVFPDILRLESLMLAELKVQKKNDITKATTAPLSNPSIKDRINCAKAEADRRQSSNPGKQPGSQKERETL